MDQNKFNLLLRSVFFDLENDIRATPMYAENVEYYKEVDPDIDFDEETRIDLFVEKQGDSDDFDAYIRSAHRFIKHNHINKLNDAEVESLLSILKDLKLLDTANLYTGSKDPREQATHKVIARLCYIIFKDMPI